MSSNHPTAIDIIHILVRSTHYVQREFYDQLQTLDAPFQLTGPRLRLLSVVAESGKIRMNELAVKLGIKPRTVTDFIDALEQEKLLVRLPDPTDRRATLIQLTELAQSHIEQVLAFQNKIADNVLNNLSAQQQQQFYDLLTQLIIDKDISETCEEHKK